MKPTQTLKNKQAKTSKRRPWTNGNGPSRSSGPQHPRKLEFLTMVFSLNRGLKWKTTSDPLMKSTWNLQVKKISKCSGALLTVARRWLKLQRSLRCKRLHTGDSYLFQNSRRNSFYHMILNLKTFPTKKKAIVKKEIFYFCKARPHWRLSGLKPV